MILNDLAFFTVVARHLNFSEAAKELNIPLSRVSRRIAELENYLEIKLFERTTRHVRLTEEGKYLLDECQEPIEALQDITGLSGDTDKHTIRITAPPLAVHTSIGPRLLDFTERNPNISLSLTSTNSMLDFYRENIDIAFRLGPLSDSSLIAKRLWTVPYSFCASDSFIKRHSIDKEISIDQFLTLPAIIAGQKWVLESGAQVQPQTVVHEIDDLYLIREAAQRGMGVALLPTDFLTPPLCVIELSSARPLEREMFAVYPSKRFLPTRVRNLIDFMSSS